MILKRQLGPCEAGDKVYVGPKFPRQEWQREEWGELLVIQAPGYMHPIAYIHEVSFNDYFMEEA